MAENSRALPVAFYRDPSLVAEQNELVEMGCRACSWHVYLLGRVSCSNPAVTNTKKVPHIGSKCRKFKLQES
ncbi:MAG: hypothetical protein ACSHWN_04640 [Methylophilaceae bacterium]